MAKKIEVKNKIDNTKKVSIKEKKSDNENEILLKKNTEQEDIIKSLQNQMAQMQSAFIKMQSGQNTQPQNNGDKKYSIGCRLINGVTLYSPKREVERRISYGQLSDVTEYEMDMLLKNGQVREFLKKDVVFFSDESDYDTFKIMNRSNISDERLEYVALNLDSNKLIDELNKWTREKKDDPVLHSLFYRFVELHTNGRIVRMTYENRKAIENYFRFTIDNAQLLLSNINKIK